MLNLGSPCGDLWKIQVIGESIDYEIIIARDEGFINLTPDILGLETFGIFNYENITFKVQCFYNNGIACSNLYDV